jgi:hypothetical protein
MSSYRKEADHGRDSRPSPYPTTACSDPAAVVDACGLADSTCLADSEGLADSNSPAGCRGKSADRGTGMTFFARSTRRPASADEVAAAATPPGGADATPTEETRLPFAGYDRLGAKELVARLAEHSQVELAAVERYERSHKGRAAVFDKLRYLRGREPLPGYDALSAEEILAAVQKADSATIKRVRGYERKFRKRPRVLDEVDRIRHARRAAEPARTVPSYEPMSRRRRRARAGATQSGAP